MIVLTDLKNEIKNIPLAEPVMIYIGVGAASSAGQHPLALDQYQQFPPFLQDIRNQVPNLHLFLILIDPFHENPPRVAVDYALHDKHRSQGHYSSADGFLQTFVYRLSVYTDPDSNPPVNGLNITSTLRELNTFAQENRLSMLYHDFTGRRTALLAEYFELEIRGHLDQIIYGLSAREDHGCFFDLTQPTAYMPFRIDQGHFQRPVIKMFNYYNYIVNNTYHLSASDLEHYPPAMHPLAALQKKQIITMIRTVFKNTILSLLRQVYHLLHKEEEEEEVREIHRFNDVAHPYQRILEDMYREKKYTLLNEVLRAYSANELDILAKLSGMEMTGEQLLHLTTLSADPYQWGVPPHTPHCG
jgi:hypothetical protein